MSLESGLSNLLFYCIQTGFLILVGALLVWIFRLREPSVLHLYWRLLLVVCLLLLFQPEAKSSLPELVSVPLIEEAGLATAPQATASAGRRLNFYPWLGGVLVAGVLLRLIWLGIGFYRLHRLRRTSRVMTVEPHLQVLRDEMEVVPQFRVSAKIGGPVTFGWLRPVIVLPEFFAGMDRGMQRAVVCHELLHVKRRDWTWNTLEEMARTLFWFHPAFHWIIGRIQLTREQVVDRKSVTLLGSNKAYLQSLLETARRGVAVPSVPAPLFLAECQLSRRVELLLQEVEMSKTKSNASVSVCFVLVGLAGWWCLSVFPTVGYASPQLVREGPAVEESTRNEVASRVQAGRLSHRVSPKYPAAARISGVEGIVHLSVLIGEGGEVQGMDVLEGDAGSQRAAVERVKVHRAVPVALHGEAVVDILQGETALESSAMEAVRHWRWEPGLRDGNPVPARTTVSVQFQLYPNSRVSGLLLRVDADGGLWDQVARLDGDRLMHRAREAGGAVVIRPDRDVPGSFVMDAVQLLKRSGIDRVFVLSRGPIEF